MKIVVQGNTLTLEKNGVCIGQCQYRALSGASGIDNSYAALHACDEWNLSDTEKRKRGISDARAFTPLEITQFAIEPQWQRKGYGSYLCKELLKRTGGYTPKTESYYCIALPRSAQSFPTAFFAKFGFTLQESASMLVRHKKPDLTAIAFAQQFLAQQLRNPTLCIDATCGNGHDSLFLAQNLGEKGHLIALDLQESAVENTAARLAAAGIAPERYTLRCENHANLAQHAAPNSADAILFNFGWLPGADHSVFSGESSSLPALQAALDVLKPGGVLSAILYSGEGIGNAEKTAILAWLRALPIAQYTVLVCEFANWADTAPLPCFVMKK